MSSQAPNDAPVPPRNMVDTLPDEAKKRCALGLEDINFITWAKLPTSDTLYVNLEAPHYIACGPECPGTNCPFFKVAPKAAAGLRRYVTLRLGPVLVPRNESPPIVLNYSHAEQIDKHGTGDPRNEQLLVSLAEQLRAEMKTRSIDVPHDAPIDGCLKLLPPKTSVWLLVEDVTKLDAKVDCLDENTISGQVGWLRSWMSEECAKRGLIVKVLFVCGMKQRDFGSMMKPGYKWIEPFNVDVRNCKTPTDAEWKEMERALQFHGTKPYPRPEPDAACLCSIL